MSQPETILNNLKSSVFLSCLLDGEHRTVSYIMTSRIISAIDQVQSSLLDSLPQHPLLRNLTINYALWDEIEKFAVHLTTLQSENPNAVNRYEKAMDIINTINPLNITKCLHERSFTLWMCSWAKLFILNDFIQFFKKVKSVQSLIDSDVMGLIKNMDEELQHMGDKLADIYTHVQVYSVTHKTILRYLCELALGEYNNLKRVGAWIRQSCGEIYIPQQTHQLCYALGWLCTPISCALSRLCHEHFGVEKTDVDRFITVTVMGTTVGEVTRSSDFYTVEEMVGEIRGLFLDC